MRTSSSISRVGFDARWYNESGVGTYVVELLRAMAAEPREFEFVVYEDPQNPIPGVDRLAVEKISVRSPRYSLIEQWEFRERARKDRLDLFHSPFYAAPPAIGCPVVITIHDLIPFMFSIYNWPKQQLVRFGYRFAAWRAQHVIADSDSTARDVRHFLKIAPERVSSVPLAAASCFRPERECGELEHLRTRYNVQPPYVLLSSARNWRTKNLATALRGLHLARRVSNVEFQTVVSGPREGIDACVSKEKQDLDLNILGFIDSADLAALFRNAVVFIMPSLYEGFGLPVVEAMACGCAVVSSNAGSLAEVAGDGAQIFEPFDVAGMAAAVSRVLREPEDLNHWRKAALLRAKDFCWRTTAARTKAIYGEVLRQESLRLSSAKRGAAAV